MFSLSKNVASFVFTGQGQPVAAFVPLWVRGSSRLGSESEVTYLLCNPEQVLQL